MNTTCDTTSQGISCLLFDADPARVSQQSHQNPFDVIVIGSGMGGGVLAHSLCQNGQRVLLIERGDLLFTTHALNTTRPHADLSKTTGPTQDNDIVYSLLKKQVKLTDQSDKWTGGPLYCVGGRSNAWGLYIPRMDKKTLDEYFPKGVVADLVDNEDTETGNYYKRAEFMMVNRNFHRDKHVNEELIDSHQSLIGELNGILEDKKVDADKRKELVESLVKAIEQRHGASNEPIDVKPIACQLGKSLKDYSAQHSESVRLADLHWALMGAQFNSHDRYEFPQGAFSSTDRILESVFRTHNNVSSRMQPPFMTVIHNTLAIGLVVHNNEIREVKTVTATGLQHSFRGKRVVLCAGTLDSPALLLRSGIEVQPRRDVSGKARDKGGKVEGDTGDGALRVAKYTGVTDHNIYGFRFSIKDGRDVQAAKLQVEGEVSVREPRQAGGGEDKDKTVPQVEGEVSVHEQSQAGGGEDKDKTIPFLLNICINAHSFLSRDFEEIHEGAEGLCTLTYEFRAPINNHNYVALDAYTGQPILHIKNSGEETVPGGKMNPNVAKRLSELNRFIEQTIRQAMHESDDGRQSQLKEDQKWKAAGLGCVAHEIGTLPMAEDPARGVVDANLKFHKFSNLYACDMSVLPVSAPANPSLTLVALALRLSDHLSQL